MSSKGKKAIEKTGIEKLQGGGPGRCSWTRARRGFKQQFHIHKKKVRKKTENAQKKRKKSWEKKS